MVNGQTARQAGAVDVQVSRSDVNDVEIRIAKFVQFTGAVSVKESDTSSASQDPLIPLILVNADTNEFVHSGMVQSDEVSFESILPGRYKLVPLPGLSARAFLGESEILNQTFTIGSASPPFRVVLTKRTGVIRGTVEKGENSTVVLIPQRPDGPAIGQTILCGPDGSFEMTEVSPGDYFIAAFNRIDGLPPASSHAEPDSDSRKRASRWKKAQLPTSPWT